MGQTRSRRTLTDSPNQEARLAFQRAVAVLDPIRFAFWNHYGFTLPLLRLMRALYFEDNISVGELADRLNVRPPTITGLTDKLVNQALVTREVDSEDRRVVRVRLTDQGRQVLDESDRRDEALMDQIFVRLGEAKVRRLIDAWQSFADAAQDLRMEGTKYYVQF